MKNGVIRRADILLPAENVSPEKWAVVAVDQYTSQPEYWQKVEEIVGDAPSAVKVTLPEVYLKDTQARTERMQKTMREYLKSGVLAERVKDGFILVERTTGTGARIGLMACLDLEKYDFAKGSQSLIRATEGTVIERVPPRVEIRRGAAIELPHVLMLLDDPGKTALEPLYADRDSLEKLYDFELMQQGGHLRGWRVSGEALTALENSLDALYDGCEGLFLAVGDGNHSLAAARQYWLELKESLPEAEREEHPARYALVEIENLHSPAIRFEPIHRILTNVDPDGVLAAYEKFLAENGAMIREGGELTAVYGKNCISYGFDGHPLRMLQEFLDAYLKVHPEAEIDYIHGDDTLMRLAEADNSLGFMPCAFAKADLFPYIRRWGVLPRKTFSMGHANEKRFYFEARKIEK